MYQVESFREDDVDAQIALVRANPLGLIVSQGPQGLMADPLPFLIDRDEQGEVTLRAHLSRGNPHWSVLQAGQECLVVFQGAEGYISPGWYETKRRTGKAVPTWDYAAVQMWGTPTVTQDSAWLRQLLTQQTAVHEGNQPQPWQLDDAPADYIAANIQGIIGIEIAVTRREGKWKMSQNRSAVDIDGVIEGLRGGDDSQQRLATEVERRRR
ncbi:MULTISPECIES: FMN-binding negative transcriptional regulator [unclassified Serratia (in: enterobacteria)]|uniref:FMN-binding negative transcriptional regulator n=1 Tax=unclassified Serratia (in: enterobacteria) TaxID=2647522 RepID=UPI0004A7F592|nr:MULTISPECIES: FMN-binding negative transcriptional regulator [unclassified Serratia (in: enterobacteria)]